ncbi:MAG: membrane protein insertase YidC, partial [Janthinobacterium lividum]
MDNKRLFLAVVLSVAILVGFEWLMPKQSPQVLHRQAQQSTQATPAGSAPRPVTDLAPPGTQPAAIAPLSPDARLPIDASRLQGSIDLVGARLDDLVLRDYQETIKPGSPHVRVLEPQDQKQPNLVQLGWSASGTDVKVPDGTSVWTSDQPKLTPDTPVTLSWENGAGLTFQIALAVDRNYMFTVEQRVRNTTGQPVSLYPWSRISRSYTPQVTGGYLVHEGPIAVVNGRLEEMSYTSLKSKAAEGDGTGWSAQQASGPDGGWGGITDKYWLTAIIPGHDQPVTASYRYQPNEGAGTYQVDFISQAPMVVAAGATASTASHVFAGAKEVHLLETYQAQLHATDFWKAVDFGWFAFL